VLASPTQIPVQRKNNSAPHPPAHIIDPSTTIACNMSDTYSEAEKRIEQALDEMRALEPAPVIADFARQYDVPMTEGSMELRQNSTSFREIANFQTLRRRQYVGI
jgi:hypothetical protein